VLYNVTVTSKLISSLLAVYQPDLEYRTFPWPVRSLHRHQWNIMAHNLVAKIKKKLTRSKVDTQFAFTRDRSSKFTIWLSIPPVTRELSPYLRPDLISIWSLTRDAVCRGKSLRVQQASHPKLVLNQAPHQAEQPVWICVTVVSPNPASFDHFLVKKLLLAFVIVHGWYQESGVALQMLLGMVWLRLCLFGASHLPEPSIRQSNISSRSHRSSWLHIPIPVVSIRQVSSASAGNSPCGIVLFGRLCPSPSEVNPHHSACWALNLLHHLPRLPHSAHRRNLQDRSDCFR